ncbi:MAG TPA: sigma-70 family RNA polymerase sigma factor [Chitinophagales bacterium]|nr:sigma-70 family RNA polymerase sigma factor [Chitinophagales bacterium]HRK27687.1 sigma-70 family RNA polymerase sigma factor [Chitinophagales bacterium]
MGFFTFWLYDFIDNESWFYDLLAENNKAIAYLVRQAEPRIRGLCKSYHLTEDETKDIVSECFFVLLKQLREGKYQYQGFSPVTYVLRIAQLLISNLLRKHGRKYESNLDPDFDTAEEDMTEYNDTKEKIKRLRHIITAQLGEHCTNLIWMKHIEGKKDSEVIAENLTQYRTVQALANARCNCMNQVRQLFEKLNVAQHDI